MADTKFLKTTKIQFLKKKWKKALIKKNVTEIRKASAPIDEQDLANWIKSESPALQIFFIRSLENVKASEVFNVLDEDTVASLIQKFTKAETKKVIASLYTDDIVDIIEELPSNLVSRVLESISPQQRKDVNFILNYPDDTVGSEMNVDFIKFNLNTPVSEAVDAILKQEKQKIDQPNAFYYVVNEKNLLVGYVTAEDILANQSENRLKISQIMETNVISVRARADQDNVLIKVRKYRISQFPVVDEQNKLIGVLDSQAALDILEKEYAEDISKIYGVSPSPLTENYFQMNALKQFFHRVPWLIITLIISTLSQIIITPIIYSELNHDSAKWLRLILPYLPFMLTLIGNIALQSSGVVSKYIVLGQIKKNKYWATLFKEIKIACFTLLFVFFVIFIRKLIIDIIFPQSPTIDDSLLYLKESFLLIFIICISILVTVILAASLPIFAVKFKQDPVIMASPILTTLIDVIVTGLAFLLAYLLLK